MLKENRKELLDDNYLLNKRENSRQKTRFIRQKHRLFILGVFLGLLIFIALYLSLDISNIYDIKVNGNTYLSAEYYQKLSGLDTDDKYLLTISPLIESRIKKDPLIESVKVRLDDDMIITIEIQEKEVIGYIYEDLPYLILSDASKVSLKEDYMDVILKVPFIEGYSDEELKLIAKGFKDMDPILINEISEIHKYPFSYDDMMMEVVMRDGNYVYMSYYAMHLLDSYYAFASKIDSQKPVCIFIDDLSSSAYTSECPYKNQGKTSQDETKNTQENDSTTN